MDWLAEKQMRDAGRGHLTRDGAAAILNARDAAVFDCDHCGDGDALREGEACAYCGRLAGEP